jgi:hypothetical protein
MGEAVNDDNMIHVHEREEARDAARFATGPCWRHDYVSDRRSGGVCVDCGDTLRADEL